MARRLAVGMVAIVGLLVIFGADATASRARHRPRQGCGTFCQQAGGLGGSPDVAPCTVRNSKLVARNGKVAVRVRCHGKRTARGALVIFPHDFDRNAVTDGVPNGSYNGVNLVVAPGTTVTFRIPLSKQAAALLARRGGVSVDVLIELNTKPRVQASERRGIPLTIGTAQAVR